MDKICKKCGTVDRYKGGDCKECRSRYNKRYRQAHIDELYEYHQQYDKQYRQDNSLDISRQMKQIHLDLKIETFNQYGGCQCTLCKINDIDMLSIDHIFNNGNEHRKNLGINGGHQFYYWLKKYGFPDKDKYRVLCMNCQFKEKERNRILNNSEIAIYDRKHRLSIKTLAINTYGNGKCSLCNETDIVCLSIDHINGGGRQHRREIGDIYLYLKRNKYPDKDKYRILCINCQFKER
jgi:hypothetical protein